MKEKLKISKINVAPNGGLIIVIEEIVFFAEEIYLEKWLKDGEIFFFWWRLLPC